MTQDGVDALAAVCGVLQRCAGAIFVLSTAALALSISCADHAGALVAVRVGERRYQVHGIDLMTAYATVALVGQVVEWHPFEMS